MKTLKEKRIKNIYKGKVKGVGFFEGIKLKITGLLDGLRKLPKETADGDWLSPHLDRELRSFNEFSTRMWGCLQVEEEQKYARICNLKNSLADIEDQLAAAKKKLEEAILRESTVRVSRRHGEDNLTDRQVEVRRANEKAARLAPYHNAILTLEDKLVAMKEEIITLSSEIAEDNNTTRLICTKVGEHLRQRIDVYWNSAMRTHADRDSMPVVPALVVESNAESVYMEPHAHLFYATEKRGVELPVKTEKEVA